MGVVAPGEIDRTLPGTVIITSVTSVSEGFRPIGDK